MPRFSRVRRVVGKTTLLLAVAGVTFGIGTALVPVTIAGGIFAAERMTLTPAPPAPVPVETSDSGTYQQLERLTQIACRLLAVAERAYPPEVVENVRVEAPLSPCATVPQ